MKDLYNKVAMEAEHSDGETEDPFYDDFPWFRLIGRSFVYLRNLFYGLSMDQKVPIVNERAEILGALLVRVETVAGGLAQVFEIYSRYVWNNLLLAWREHPTSYKVDLKTSI